jgi:putative flippase GtrA
MSSSPPVEYVAEARMAARALVSSGIATLIDGIVYNTSLVAVNGRYTIAAILGALLGAVTNFLISRYWVFPPTMKRIDHQALQYMIGSLLTYFALQASLMLFIEGMHMDEHIAWFPAKVVAWVLVSYPFSRFVAFKDATERTR